MHIALFIGLTCSILVISIYLQAAWNTVWILISWLPRHDLYCFQYRIFVYIYRFSMVRVKEE